KVADYPFTTLEPALGVVYVGDYQSFVMADIPGIIEGAHEGKGLGLQFLKHIERNAVLLFVIPIDSKDLAGEYETLLGELRSYDEELLNKPRLVALSKIDLLPPEERDLLPEIVADEFPDDLPLLPISAVAQIGLDELRHRLWSIVRRRNAQYEAVE
ncbi:MAG: GTPase, partial [Rhodothermales bacterium]